MHTPFTSPLLSLEGLLFSDITITALLTGVVAAVAGYVSHRFMDSHRRHQQEALMAERELQHKREMERSNKNSLDQSAQDLAAPLTIVVESLVQTVGDDLSDSTRDRLMLTLRSAQLLADKVNRMAGTTVVRVPDLSTIKPAPRREASAATQPIIQPKPQPAAPPVPQPVPPPVAPPIPSAAKDGQTTHIDDSNAGAMGAGQLPEIAENENRMFTLLMVDDNADMCRFVHDYFRGQYIVLTAHDGMEAIKQLQEHDEVDLVVSDIDMPNMNGLQLCKQVKTNLRWSHIPVILLTGRTEPQLEAEGLQEGADDYITKPFNVAVLSRRIRNAIENRKNRQRQFREAPNVQAADITITSMDEQFLQQALDICEAHLTDTDFSVEALGHELSLSRTYLYKKLINITGKGPAEFIRTIRLKRAKKFLEDTEMSVAEIAAAIGFSNPKRFTENFKAEYGMSPSEYLKRNRNTTTA